MKKHLILSLFISLFQACFVYAYTMENGDIVFQESGSHQSKHIAIATNSNLTHCGIIKKEQGNWYVIEAVGPVKKTLLKEWILRGNESRYAVARVKKSKVNIQRVIVSAEKMIGKPYDIFFSMGNDKIYCSELVYKVFLNSGVKLAAPVRIKELNLSDEVKRELANRFPEGIPYEQEIISPEQIYSSPLVEIVYSNFK